MCNTHHLKKYIYIIWNWVEGHQRKLATKFCFMMPVLKLLSKIYEGLIKTNIEIKVEIMIWKTGCYHRIEIWVSIS